MIILDNSVVVAYLTAPAAAPEILSLMQSDQLFGAPDFIYLEFANVLRKIEAKKKLDAVRCASAIADLAGMPIIIYPVQPLLEYIWSLRHNFSGYDAAYVAVARNLGATLATRDARLAKAAENIVDVQLF